MKILNKSNKTVVLAGVRIENDCIGIVADDVFTGLMTDFKVQMMFQDGLLHKVFDEESEVKSKKDKGTKDAS